MASTRSDYLRYLMRPIVVTIAIVYFLIDLLFLSALRPIGRWIAQLKLFARFTVWVQRQNAYLVLALFVVPLAALEPAKPVGLYLIASGHWINGVAVIVIAEIIKITFVERLFFIAKDNLMTIPAFAWCYRFVMTWVDYVKSTAAWKAVAAWSFLIKQRTRQIARRIKAFYRARIG